MSLQRSSTDPVVAPAQVWDGLTAEAQAAAIQLLAQPGLQPRRPTTRSTITEIIPCLHRPAPPRSAPSISTAKP